MTIVDLSHQLSNGMPVYPGDPAVSVSPHDRLEAGGYNTSRISLGSHSGTHVDAPLHFLAGGGPVDELPLERLVGRARLIDLAPGGQVEEGARLGVHSFEPFAEFIRPGARLLCRTGWDRRFGGPGFCEGYPSIDPAAARLLAERGIWLLGLDTPSPSVEPEEVHRILLGAGVVILEALTGLERLPDEFLLAALPLKLRGCDGSPARAVAILDA